ncbi:hypothetical protein [Actinophytocola xanthii]|uniref:Uncharacterized protein n=1 Tax=Actinophytocola xanthii TaxID=1912961 RepID=A0A1Q8CE18_9PSEU|nr:hypothetical protein [Actinophytocola xanthii]OLF12617.1 hypothetical protein BU204_28705 [Actinophytocola xanthii]
MSLDAGTGAGRRNGAGAWFTPWGAARRIYGRYGPPLGDLAALDELAAPVGSVLSRLGPVLEALLTVRVWLTLNVVALIAQLVQDGADAVVITVYQTGMVTMVVGPFGLLLAVAVLVAVARTRLTAARQLLRPVLLALVTFLVSVGVFGTQLPGVRQELEGLIAPVVELARQPPLSVVAPLLGAWLLLFGLCSVYLIHHHAFGGDGRRLLDALVSVWLAWVVGVVEIANYPGGDLSTRAFVWLTVGSASVATLISVVELVSLRRSGVTFRNGPWGPS